jgi:hypothetical protein
MKKDNDEYDARDRKIGKCVAHQEVLHNRRMKSAHSEVRSGVGQRHGRAGRIRE